MLAPHDRGEIFQNLLCVGGLFGVELGKAVIDVGSHLRIEFA